MLKLFVKETICLNHPTAIKHNVLQCIVFVPKAISFQINKHYLLTMVGYYVAINFGMNVTQFFGFFCLLLLIKHMLSFDFY